MCLIVLLKIIQGSGYLKVQFRYYNNPSSKAYNGKCCESHLTFWCHNDCDNWLKFCVTKLPVKSWSQCDVYKRTRVLGDDSFTFPSYGQSLGPGFTNPLEWKFTHAWQGGFGFRVHVWDDDHGNFLGGADDFVDDYAINVYIAPGTGWSERGFSGRRSRIVAYVGVWCDTNYYGNDCATYCLAKDDASGHYTCDQRTGSKVCIKGWKGSECHLPICYCDFAHATCAEPNKCACHTGWGGLTCSTCMIKTGCVNGKCVNGGDCVCNTDWTGAFCEKDLAPVRTVQHAPILDQIFSIVPAYLVILVLYARQDLVNDFQCACLPGYTGKTCATNINECASSPCQNGAQCIDAVASYSCQCRAGYTGVHCETNINDCSPNPCRNGGTCTDGINSFSCACSSGFHGKTCHNGTNECDPNPCVNGGSCMDIHLDYNCTCLPGYTGKSCETDINECLAGICNNGSCSDKVNNYSCSCFAGYTGRNCQTNINDCDPSPCKNGADCIDGINSYKCKCQPGYPCNNSVVCINELADYKCNCMPGYTGKQCEVNVDECSPNPCNSTGTLRCVDKINAYQCVCIKGFIGKHCETNVDDCDPGNVDNIIEGQEQVTEFGYCGKHGTCIDGVDMFNCTCKKGWTDINECLPNPCQNGGKCYQTFNADFICECPRGFTGKNCSTNIDDCASSPCCAGSQCIDGLNNYTCVCPIGMKGIDCCSNSSWCDNNNTCINQNGLCKDVGNDFYCNCSRGYRGKRCEQVINECLAKPCSSSSTCIPLQGGYKCICPYGYTGQKCDIDIDDCVNNTCKNAATCIDQLGSFRCQCPSSKGYKGLFCDDVNECKSSPCVGVNTLCVNTIGSYKCVCKAGFTGPTCDTNIDDCVHHSCDKERSTRCVDKVNGYSCLCFKGWTGDKCTERVSGPDPCGCKNGACVQRLGMDTCICNKGFEGSKCDIDVEKRAEEARIKAQRESDKKKTATFSSIGAVAGALSGGIVAFVIWRCRKKQRAEAVEKTVTYNNMDAENVNFNNGDLMFKNPTYSLGRDNPGIEWKE
eukprot:gene20236-22215_t